MNKEIIPRYKAAKKTPIIKASKPATRTNDPAKAKSIMMIKYGKINLNDFHIQTKMLHESSRGLKST